MPKKNPDDDPRYLALIQLLRTAEEVLRASRDFFGRWRLGPSQFNVLNLLRLHPQGLSQTELSRYLVVHRSNITGLVDELEKRGLARREEVAEDRRAYRVRLTPDGLGLLEEILPEYYRRSVSVWGGLPDRRVSEIRSVLLQVAENAGAAAGTETDTPAPRRASKSRGSSPRSDAAGPTTARGGERSSGPRGTGAGAAANKSSRGRAARSGLGLRAVATQRNSGGGAP